jgi:hypothetical protein
VRVVKFCFVMAMAPLMSRAGGLACGGVFPWEIGVYYMIIGIDAKGIIECVVHLYTCEVFYKAPFGVLTSR